MTSAIRSWATSATRKGFNSGGFGVEQLSCKRRVSPFLPEELQNLEVGIRSDLADGLLRVNATVFHTEWNDIQLAGESIDDCVNPPVVGTNLRTQNVASAEAEGVEVELTIAPTENLLFNVNLGLLDTQYVGITTPVPGLTLNTEFSQAPEKTGNVGVQHTRAARRRRNVYVALRLQLLRSVLAVADPELPEPNTTGCRAGSTRVETTASPTCGSRICHQGPRGSSRYSERT